MRARSARFNGVAVGSRLRYAAPGGWCIEPARRAKRLAIWTQWLDTTLLAPVPHRQVVLTIPKRLRAYCLDRRRLLGEIARDEKHDERRGGVMTLGDGLVHGSSLVKRGPRGKLDFGDDRGRVSL